MDLLLVTILSLILVPLALFSSGPLRIALGLLLALFFPGYTLIAALFPEKTDLGGIERLALSFGLSIAVVPLTALVLNYTSWGISLQPILFSLLGFILAMTAVALYRRQRLRTEERFQVDLRFRLPREALRWRQSRWDKVLTVLLALGVLGAIGMLVYLIQTPKVEDEFTEFYILGPWGEAEGYPKVLVLGEEATVTLWIVNHEHEVTDYKLEVTISGQRVRLVGPITLEHEGTWEQPVTFRPIRTGPDQKVEFLLYTGDASEPYQTLHLTIDVRQ